MAAPSEPNSLLNHVDRLEKAICEQAELNNKREAHFGERLFRIEQVLFGDEQRIEGKAIEQTPLATPWEDPTLPLRTVAAELGEIRVALGRLLGPGTAAAINRAAIVEKAIATTKVSKPPARRRRR